MAISDQLLAEISNVLGPSLNPSLTTSSATSDLFEGYIFSLVVQAAVDEGAQVSYRDPNDNPTTNFIFRTSPGYLWSSTQPYTFAFLQWNSGAELEAHLGVRVSGKSKVLHEFDVCVLERTEAQMARQGQVHPRQSRVVIGVECKFYTTSLSLGLARAFIGLGTDVKAKSTWFVSNTSSASIQKLLTHKNRKWGSTVHPGSHDSDVISGEFRSAFKYYLSA